MRPLVRRMLLVLLDMLATMVAVFLAFIIRFALDSTATPTQYVVTYAMALPAIVPARTIIYYVFGLYKQVWSHASVPELLRIVYAVTVDTVISAVIIALMPDHGFPRSVFIIGWFLKVSILGGIRLALRLRHEWYRTSKAEATGTSRVLIIGAGDAGARLVREYAKHPEMGCTVVGYIDDDPNKRGYHVAGKPVLGVRAQLLDLVRAHQVTDLIVALPSVHGQVIRSVVDAAGGLGIRIRTLPALYELMNGTVSVTQVRDVQIEDVLGREEVQVDLGAIADYLSDEVVLVTGAGGSIGSEICRQVARFSPRQLVLLGHGENSIYEIHLELNRQYPGIDIRPVIADIQDEPRIRRIFESIRPGVVFHAAAHKHVPLMEYNAEEAIKNNLFGTVNVARAADLYKVKRFVLISSDKAVNPTSVMGATKRSAEFVIQSMARTSDTVFVAVRFGNVLGSRGSVIPLFKRQIAAGGPITLTDRRMVRYFMTIPEASRLVIQAASMGVGGEIFVLDMGKPVRILDLAHDLIRLSGLVPDVDIRIVETGMREGEKLFEELLTSEEGTVATQHQRIFVARGDFLSQKELHALLDTMRDLIQNGKARNEQIRAVVAASERHGVQALLRGAVGIGD